MDHNEFLKKAENFFIKKGYTTKTEVPLKNGKGAADLFAYNDFEKIYSEIKSSSASLNQKKVQKQLNKYEREFGKENKYALISPDANNNIKIDWFKQ